MFQEEAEKHWQYVKSVIEQHNENLDKPTIDIIGFHYITAMVHGYKHGYKHGYNDTMQDNKIDLSNRENINYNEMLEVEKFIMSSSTYHDNFYSNLQIIDNSNYRHNLIDIKLTDGRIKTLKLI